MVVTGWGEPEESRPGFGERHPWPGGRREPGESYVDAAVREVHEGTGWVVEPASARYVGWLHLEHLAPRREGYVYPYPDFLQLVLCARAERPRRCRHRLVRHRRVGRKLAAARR